jgi:hypothetical protein
MLQSMPARARNRASRTLPLTQVVGIARTNECERIPVVANAPHRDGARDISRKPQRTRVLD